MFLNINLYPATLLNSFNGSNSFLMESLGFCIYSSMSSANNDSFSSSFLIWRPLISCLIAVARTLNTMSNKHGEGGYPCLVPDCKEKAFSCLPLTVMLALGLSPVAFIMLEVHLF